MANNVRFNLILEFHKPSALGRTVEVRAILLGPMDKINDVLVTFYVNGQAVPNSYRTDTYGAVSMYYPMKPEEKELPEFTAVAHVPDFGDVSSKKEKPLTPVGTNVIPAIKLEEVYVGPGHRRYFIALIDSVSRFTLVDKTNYLIGNLGHTIYYEVLEPKPTNELVREDRLLKIDLSTGYTIVDLINKQPGKLEIDMLLWYYAEAHQEIILFGPTTQPIKAEADDPAEVHLWNGCI